MSGRRHIENILLIITTGIAAFFSVKGAEILSEDHFARGKEILALAFEQAGNRAVEVYLPQVLYETREEKEIEAVTQEDGDTASVLEDESTSQEIIEENEKALEQWLMRENLATTAKLVGEADLDSGHSPDETHGSQDGQDVQSGQDQGRGDETVQDEQAGASSGEAVGEGAASAGNPDGDVIPVVAPMDFAKLQDFNYLLPNFFVVDANTTGEESELNLAALSNRDMTIHTDASKPQILIYHTHSQEEYIDSDPADPKTTVIGVGDYLTQLLQETYGYQVLHNTDHFDLESGTLDRSKAYNYAEPVIAEILASHPSVEVVIDLHRDGVDDSKHLVTQIDGQPTAKIMFFNGLSRTREKGVLTSLPNPCLADNLAFSFQLELLAKQCYPDFVRCIYLKGYRYNLHLRPKSLLLEVGAQTNTVAEAMQAMPPFARLLHAVLQGKEPLG